ncbi:MAG TPA: flagellar biosynthesis protein FlgA [Nitrospiraceae bacterium]|nr:flagellar biosynthesis protein FlgA [Nitrospiraceae bacterium]HCZ11109.1 flagellar biosynthesis protein FlgA [Nitrospiraceae bacterium]
MGNKKINGEKSGTRAGILVFSFIFSLLTLHTLSVTAFAERIKDIATFSGVRENELIGYGIVVGLNGTGDKDGTYIFQPFANMLTRMGVSINPADVKGKTKNIAAVIVTAKLSTMVRPGSKVDVQVSSIGDAKSLQGGMLLMTPLVGPDNNTYAVAQGAVSIGGFVAGGAGAQTIKNHPNVGTIPNGAIVEREVPVQLNSKNKLDVLLMAQDITTAKRVAEKINGRLGGAFAQAEGPSSISVAVPDSFANRVVELMSVIELINVNVDMPARVVVNERTGTVVVGENVVISPVALAHGGLTVEVKTEYQVSQPLPFAPAGAETVTVPQKEVKAEEKRAALTEVKGTTIGQLVKALNALGVSPKDMVAILQAIKTAGSLKADLVIM